jgi:hypothetical protein
VKALFYHVIYGSLPFHIPSKLVSSQISDPKISISYSGLGVAQGKSALLVQVNPATSDAAEAAVRRQLWYFDTGTGLPLRVEYRIPDTTDMNAWGNAAIEFSNFKNVGGVLIPFSMTFYQEGIALSGMAIGTVDFNVGLSPSEFDLLGGN